MDTTMPAQAVRDLIDAQDRIRELEGEVRRLKVDLAARSPSGVMFGPSRQADRDAILRRISKG